MSHQLLISLVRSLFVVSPVCVPVSFESCAFPTRSHGNSYEFYEVANSLWIYPDICSPHRTLHLVHLTIQHTCATNLSGLDRLSVSSFNKEFNLHLLPSISIMTIIEQIFIFHHPLSIYKSFQDRCHLNTA